MARRAAGMGDGEGTKANVSLDLVISAFLQCSLLQNSPFVAERRAKKPLGFASIPERSPLVTAQATPSVH